MTDLSPTPLTNESVDGLMVELRCRADREAVRNPREDDGGKSGVINMVLLNRAVAALSYLKGKLAERDADVKTNEVRIGELETDLTNCMSLAAIRADRIAALEARNAELVKALQKYGRHTGGCNTHAGHDCSCGLVELRAAL